MLLINLNKPISVLSQEGDFRKGKIILAKRAIVMSYVSRLMLVEVIDLFNILPKQSLDNYTDEECFKVEINLDNIVSIQDITKSVGI